MRKPHPKKKPPVAKPPAPRLLGPALGLLALALVVYAPGFRNGYVNFDDGTYIIVNKWIYEVPPGSEESWIKAIWWPSKQHMFYPLVFTSFRFERQIEQAFGIIQAGKPPDPHINHAINILLHGLAGIVLWRCLIRLGLSAGLAYFATTLWLVHPLQAESVVWAVERKNTLAGLFCFATVLMYARAGTRMACGAYFAGLLLFLCALLSKSAFLLLPVTLLLSEWAQRRPLSLPAFVRALPFFVIALIFATVTVRGEHQAIIVDVPSIATRLAIAGMGLWFYLGKLIWPVGIAVIYPRWDVTVSALTLLPLFAAVAAGVAWLVYAVRKSPSKHPARAAVLVATAHYVFTLAPALGLIPFGYMELSFVANHFLYVPIVGPIVLVVLALDVLRRRAGAQRPAIAGAAVLIAALGISSFARSLPWKDTTTLSNHILESNPECAQAHMVLGLELPVVKPNDPTALDEGIEHLQRAVNDQPERLRPHLALATLLIDAGRHAEAAEELVAAVKCAPQAETEVWKLLSRIIRKRAYRDVITACDGLLELQPKSARALLTRGRCYLELGDMTSADRDFDAALAIAPKYRQAVEEQRRRVAAQSNDSDRP